MFVSTFMYKHIYIKQLDNCKPIQLYQVAIFFLSKNLYSIGIWIVELYLYMGAYTVR